MADHQLATDAGVGHPAERGELGRRQGGGNGDHARAGEVGSPLTGAAAVGPDQALAIHLSPGQPAAERHQHALDRVDHRTATQGHDAVGARGTVIVDQPRDRGHGRMRGDVGHPTGTAIAKQRLDAVGQAAADQRVGGHEQRTAPAEGVELLRQRLLESADAGVHPLLRGPVVGLHA
jgi:hypothetical protein